jgi:hypothetical protein
MLRTQVGGAGHQFGVHGGLHADHDPLLRPRQRRHGRGTRAEVAKEISPFARPAKSTSCPKYRRRAAAKVVRRLPRCSPDQIPLMVDYYLARTSHESSLSRVVHTWVARPANRERAWEFFQQVLKSDVSAIQGGTTSEGVHLAAMAGSVDLVQRCFTGLEIRGDRIVLSARWPETFGCLHSRSTYRGSSSAPPDQRKGRDHQRGSTRRARSRSGMPWSRRPVHSCSQGPCDDGSGPRSRCQLSN